MINSCLFQNIFVINEIIDKIMYLCRLKTIKITYWLLVRLICKPCVWRGKKLEEVGKLKKNR